MLGKLRSAVAEFGWLRAVPYGINRLCARLGHRDVLFLYRFVAQPVADRPALPPGRGRSIAVRPIAAGDPALAQTPLTPEVLAYRFDQGARCLGAFHNDALIGYTWLCLGPYREDEVRAVFAPSPEARASWDFDIYLRPEARGGLGFLRLWDEVNAVLRERGIAWSISRISAFNPGSMQVHGRLGARELGWALFLRLRGWQLAVASCPPRLHLSTSAASRPTYRLAPPGGPLDANVN